MDYVLNWLWQGTIIALAAAAALRLLERARAAARYTLCWTALLLVLALPLAFIAPGGGAAYTADAAAALPPISMPTGWWSSAVLLVAFCAAWSAVHVVRFGRGVAALRRARRACSAVPADVEPKLRHWQAIRLRGRAARLVISPHVKSAAVIGCGSPVIALTPAMLERLPADEIDRIVVHEWAHVQRYDDIAHLAELAVRAIVGWHPAVWWLGWQLHIERESACDEMAVKVTGNARSYASSLVMLAARLGGSGRLELSLGAVSAPLLRRRIVRVLAGGTLFSTRSSAGAVAAAVLMLGGGALTVAGHRMVEASRVIEPVNPVQLSVASSAASAALPAFMPTQETMPTRPVPAAASASVEPREPAPSVTIPPPVESNTTPPAPMPTPATEPTLASSALAPGSISALALAAPPPSRTTIAVAETETPWGAAAEAGAAVGRRSQQAGEAAGAFFTRFGKSIAGAF